MVFFHQSAALKETSSDLCLSIGFPIHFQTCLVQIRLSLLQFCPKTTGMRKCQSRVRRFSVKFVIDQPISTLILSIHFRRISINLKFIAPENSLHIVKFDFILLQQYLLKFVPWYKTMICAVRRFWIKLVENEVNARDEIAVAVLCSATVIDEFELYWIR